MPTDKPKPKPRKKKNRPMRPRDWQANRKQWERDMELAKAQTRGEVDYGYGDMLMEEDDAD